MKYGCDLDARDCRGFSALDIGVFLRHRSFITYLLYHCPILDSYTTKEILKISKDNDDSNIYVLFVYKEAGLLPSSTTASVDARYNSPNKAKLVLRCQEELARMNEMRFRPKFTLRDVLAKRSPECLARYARNEALCALVDGKVFARDYPIYGELIQSLINRGRYRRALLDEATLGLQTLLNYQLPVLCIERICHYLDNRTLESLL